MRASYRATLLCAVAFLFAATVSTGLAQAPYPTQQIRIICPFPAGGGTDLTARLLGEHLTRSSASRSSSTTGQARAA